MTRLTVLILGALLSGACGTTRPGAPVARPETARTSNPARATAPAPANAPEMDPANTERRFGVAEARERKQEAKRKQQDEQKRIEVGPQPGRTP